MRDLKRAQQAQRRGGGAPKWRLYESPTGRVPKDLVTMFAGIPTPQIARSVAVFLTLFPKKTQKLRRLDIARADDRFGTMKDGCS